MIWVLICTEIYSQGYPRVHASTYLGFLEPSATDECASIESKQKQSQSDRTMAIRQWQSDTTMAMRDNNSLYELVPISLRQLVYEQFYNVARCPDASHPPYKAAVFFNQITFGSLLKFYYMSLVYLLVLSKYHNGCYKQQFL